MTFFLLSDSNPTFPYFQIYGRNSLWRAALHLWSWLPPSFASFLLVLFSLHLLPPWNSACLPFSYYCFKASVSHSLPIVPAPPLLLLNRIDLFSSNQILVIITEQIPLGIFRIKTKLEPNSCPLYLQGPERIPQNPGASWDLRGLCGLVGREQFSSQIDWEFESQLCHTTC